MSRLTCLDEFATFAPLRGGLALLEEQGEFSFDKTVQILCQGEEGISSLNPVQELRQSLLLLNQIDDGLEELYTFRLNFDDSYLHTDWELFRIATGLLREADAAEQNSTPF